MPGHDWSKLKCVSIDLFDTIIALDTSDLPRVQWQGKEIPSTAPRVYDEISRFGCTLPFEAFLPILQKNQDDVLAEKEERNIEISATIRFLRLAEKLDIGSDDLERMDIAKRLTKVHMDCIDESSRVIDGTRPLIDEIRDAGVPVVLISNFDHAPAAQKILLRHDLTNSFDHLVISDGVGLRKPHPGIFQEAMNRCDATPEATLHIGDDPIADAWGAARLGLRTIWINRKSKDFPREDHLPERTVLTLREITR